MDHDVRSRLWCHKVISATGVNRKTYEHTAQGKSTGTLRSSPKILGKSAMTSGKFISIFGKSTKSLDSDGVSGV